MVYPCVMNYSFKDLYAFSEDHIAALCDGDGADCFVSVKKLIRELELRVDWLRKIKIYPIQDTKEEDLVWGMYERIKGQDSQYEPSDSEMVTIAHGGWQNRCFKRFVCAKEMLHVFDLPSERVSTALNYTLLTTEVESSHSVETRPLEKSPMMQSEIRAQWRAMLLLCPKSQRDKILAEDDGNDYEAAYKYAIPRPLIRTIKSQAYEDAYQDLILN